MTCCVTAPSPGNTTTMTNRSLAIIGGGASATLLLAHLARRPDAASLLIDVYDRAGVFGKGVAYSTPQMAHLLNVRAHNMSALVDHPDDFENWAAPHGYEPSDFVPRKLYGDYLAMHLAHAQKSLRVSFIQEDVIACRLKEANGYDLETKAGAKSYDIVIEATGNCVPLQLSTQNDIAGYYTSPWQIDYAALKNLKTIALIGSGLSAVDAILSLQAHDYTGDILIFSRNALLPAVHVQAEAYPAFITALPPTALAAFKAVRQEVKRTNAPWQSVIDSLRPFTNTIWAQWPDLERYKFLSRLFTFWNVHRHRMAPQIAGVIEDLEQTGRLRRIKASVRGIQAGPSVVTKSGNVTADAIINCLGYRYQERALSATYELGPARFGSLFETTAIPEIRAQAAQIAAQICR